MLLSRNEEIQIIIRSLENEKYKLHEMLGNMRFWASKSGAELEDSEIYLQTKANLQTVKDKIKSYEELL